MNNGVTEIVVKDCDVYDYLDQGWVEGSLTDRNGEKNAMYGRRGPDSPIFKRISVTKNNESATVTKEELSDYLSSGWVPGRDKTCCDKLSKAVSDMYDYNGRTVCGIKSILEDLHSKGIPISKYSLTRMSHGDIIRGYENLFGQVKLIQRHGEEPLSQEEINSMFDPKKVEEFPPKRKGCPKYGEDNPFYGHKHSEKTKDLIRNCFVGKSNKGGHWHSTDE